MKQDKSDFTQGNILSKMLFFMVPILGALILQAAYGAVDIMIVGRFGTTAGISGVSTGSNIVNLVTFVIAGFAMGITVIIGRYIGEKKNEKIGKVIGGSICFFFFTSLVLTAVMIAFARPLAILMKAPEEAVELTALYVRICGGGIFFIIAYNVMACIFRGLGDSQSPLIFVAIACIANIIGDLIFVAGLNMNVTGAAIATVAAQAISVILSVILMSRKKLPFKLTLKDIGFNSEIKKIVKVGSPIAFQELLTQFSFLALCAFINNLGLEASSGYGVAQKLVSFIMLIPGSLMQSMSSFVSQNVGAGLEKRARHCMLTGMAMGAFIGFFVFILVYLKGDVMSAWFSNDEDVIKRSFEYLKGFAPEAVVTAILFSFIGYYNGHSQTFFVLVQGLSQTFIIRLPFSYYMSIQDNASLTHIGWAAPLATVFGILINTAYFIYYEGKITKKAFLKDKSL